MSILVINKNKNELFNSPDVRESRFLERDGKAAGIRIAENSRAIRSKKNTLYFKKI